MSATFFVIGDLHIHVTNPEGEIERLSTFLIQKAKEISPDVIVVLGDILDKNNSVRTEAQVTAVELLGALSDIAPLLVLIGNHDVPGPLAYLSKYHGFFALRRWVGTIKENVKFPSLTGVQVVDTSPIIFEVNGLSFGACAYVPPGRFKETLDLAGSWQECKAIFAHQEIANCDFGGDSSKNGDKWNQEWPLLISGHIHKYQTMKNVLYVGSPRQTKVNEEYYKTVSKITIADTLSEERYSTGLDPIVHLHINVNEIEDLVLPDYGKVKVEVRGSVIENNLAKKLDKVKAWKKKGFNFKFHPIIESNNDEEIDVKTLNMGFVNLCKTRAIEEDLELEYMEIFG